MIDGSTNKTIASGRDAISANNVSVLAAIKAKQDAGTVVETPGNVDVSYMVSEFELEFYHVRLRRTEPNPGGSVNVDIVAKYYPAEYDAIVARNGFDNYTSATILHNPTLIVPTTATLSNNSIKEANDLNETIGVIDSDGTDATFTLGGTDAASFKISGNLLQASAVFDFVTKSVFNITITATNSAGNSGPIAAVINITQ